MEAHIMGDSNIVETLKKSELPLNRKLEELVKQCQDETPADLNEEKLAEGDKPAGMGDGDVATSKQNNAVIEKSKFLLVCEGDGILNHFINEETEWSKMELDFQLHLFEIIDSISLCRSHAVYSQSEIKDVAAAENHCLAIYNCLELSYQKIQDSFEEYRKMMGGRLKGNDCAASLALMADEMRENFQPLLVRSQKAGYVKAKAEASVQFDKLYRQIQKLKAVQDKMTEQIRTERVRHQKIVEHLKSSMVRMEAVEKLRGGGQHGVFGGMFARMNSLPGVLTFLVVSIGVALTFTALVVYLDI